MPSVPLFRWFAVVLGQPPSHSPRQVLEAVGYPAPVPSWFAEIEDREYPLLDKGDGPIPDLESRTRTRRRASGQFYTPPELIGHLLRTCEPSPGAILDPACGDGAFLLEIGNHLSRSGKAFGLEDLSGFDLDSEALLIALGRLRRAFPDHGWPRLEQRDFLLDPPTTHFDLVIGNPPYKVNLPADLRAALATSFSTAEGEKDLYTFFLERGVRCLNPGGSLVMLTSHTFLVNKHCSKIRGFLFGEHAVRRLFLLPAGFFRKALGVVPVILEVVAAQPDGQAMHLYQEYAPTSGWKRLTSANPAIFVEPTGLRHALRPPELAPIFAAMAAASQPLGTIAKVGVGIQESTTREEGNVSRFVSDCRIDETSVPTLRGKEIEPFRVTWGGKFLSYGPHLTYAGNPEVFKGAKILYQNLRHETLSRRLVAALDQEGFFPKNSLSYICNPTPPFTLRYILGLLNSELVNLWFKEQFYSFHVTVGQVRKIPIPLATPKKREKVESIVEAILERGVFAELLSELEAAVHSCYGLEGKTIGHSYVP